MILVTLQMAKVHLKGEHDDVDLQMKLDAAHEIVLDWINQRIDADEAVTWAETIAGWTMATVPKRVQQAILLQLAELHRFRGDDEQSATPMSVRPAPAVELLLSRLRDPAVA